MTRIWTSLVTASLVAILPLAPRDAGAQQADRPNTDRNSTDRNTADRRSTDDAPQAVADLELLSALERVVGRAIERAEKSVVAIARTSKPLANEVLQRDTMPDRFFGGRAPLEPVGPGDPSFVPHDFATGVIVGRGQVLTNFHVLGDPQEYDYWITTHDRRTFQMKAVAKGGDARIDLAVLEVADPGAVREGDFLPITFGDAAQLKKGQFVVALGNPYAIARDGQASASWGIVGNLGRRAPQPSDDNTKQTTPTLHHFGTLIQTDARVNLGTSGGALVNLRGEMVGLTTSQAALAGYEQSAGFAIPVDETFLRALDSLKQGKEVEYALLGINPLTRPDNGQGRHGVKVELVNSWLPAYQAGLRQGDIVTHIDGRPVSGRDDLRLMIGRLPPLAATTLTLERDGRVVQVKVTLTKFHNELPRVVTDHGPAWRGMRVDYLTGFFKPESLTSVDGPCVAVSEVEPASPTERAGLTRGAKIRSVAGTTVKTPDEFHHALAEKQGPVELTILGPSGSRTVTVEGESP
jgi:serine protease Do